MIGAYALCYKGGSPDKGPNQQESYAFDWIFMHKIIFFLLLK